VDSTSTILFHRIYTNFLIPDNENVRDCVFYSFVFRIFMLRTELLLNVA